MLMPYVRAYAAWVRPVTPDRVTSRTRSIAENHGPIRCHIEEVVLELTSGIHSYTEARISTNAEAPGLRPADMPTNC